MRTLRKPWTEAECQRLRDLHAAGAGAVRAALALKKSRNAVKTKGRELGISFQHILERRKQLKEKEFESRIAAGLSAVQADPKYRRR